MADIKELLHHAVEKGASDLHITQDLPPMLRIDGELHATRYDVLNRETTKKMVYGLLNDDQKVRFEEQLELDLSLFIPGLCRFRVNVHMQKGSVEAAFRVIPNIIKSIAELELPPIIGELARRPNGLVLVTGPTGVGKTTTLAAMVDLVNSERRCLIVSIEDPIEYVHQHKKSVVKQREVGIDTRSFASALKYALRQDPNVILVGEMRDLETISTAITAAETGHLVLSTLQQEQIKVQLSGCVQGIICQQLLPKKDKKGRLPACEIMIGTSAVRSLIREHKTEQLMTVIQTGGQYGMTTMDKAIKNLYLKGLIDIETATFRIKDKSEFDKL
jgi:twitching motility protein PilT